jgi:hypothetical protein
VPMGTPFDSRVSRVVRLSLAKPFIALESRSIRAFKSSMSFLASVGNDLVRVGVVGGEHGRECGASETRGEVWIAAEVKHGRSPSFSNCGTSGGLREGDRQWRATYTTIQFADFLF